MTWLNVAAQSATRKRKRTTAIGPKAVPATVHVKTCSKGDAVSTLKRCCQCNQEVTDEKGVEYVEILDNARFIARTPPIKARTSYFCMASCYARYLATGYAVFLKNTNVHLLHTTL